MKITVKYRRILHMNSPRWPRLKQSGPCSFHVKALMKSRVAQEARYIDRMSNYQVFKNDFAPWGWGIRLLFIRSILGLQKFIFFL